MAKKGQAVQLQQDVNTDEEWEKLLERPGLIVVDVYSDWSGPCSAMIANLKKVKVEVGGDNLQLAIAKADNISYLERFRGKCEPTWMFISNGKMVNLMFGADAPKLMNLMIDEIKREVAAKSGKLERIGIQVSDLAPEEKVRYDAAKEIEDEAIRVATEKTLRQLHERRTHVAEHVLEHTKKLGVIIVFPQAKDTFKVTLADLWEPACLAISATEKPHFTEAIIEEMLYFADYQFNEIDVVNLLSEPAVAFLIKPTSGEDFTDDIDEAVLHFVYGASKCPPGSADSPADALIGFVPVPREVKHTLETHEPLLEQNLAIPSIPSFAALHVESSKNFHSKTEMRSQLEIFSKTVIHSRELVSKTSLRDQHVEPESGEIEETLEVTGLWAPPNSFTKATAVKLLFPKIYEPIALPEPQPTPPHVAIAFDAQRKREILAVMADYPNDIMRFGFFTTDNPETATLVAKSMAKFDRQRVISGSHGEKLVIQLSKKRSEPWCVFSQLTPTFMSHTPEEGEEHCKIFFPEGYDEPEEEEEVVVEVATKKGKKGKKDKEAPAEDKVEEPAAAEEQEGEEGGQDEGAEGEEEQEEGEEEGAEENIIADDSLLVPDM